jgi:hypothetical protein
MDDDENATDRRMRRKDGVDRTKLLSITPNADPQKTQASPYSRQALNLDYDETIIIGETPQYLSLDREVTGGGNGSSKR